MSIKIMSAIFETEFRDLPYVKKDEQRVAKASTCKLVLLAIADHANDDGIAWPGYNRLARKTSLSRQGVIDTVEALVYNGILSVDAEPSRLDTNTYSINMRSLPVLARDMPDLVKPLDQGGKATLPGGVKPLDSNHHLTIIESSIGAKTAPLELPPLSIENAIFTGQPVTQEVLSAARTSEFVARRDVALMQISRYGCDLEPLALAVMDALGVVPAKKNVRGWAGCLREMLTAHVGPEHIPQAKAKLEKSGALVNDVFSLQKTAIALAAQPAPVSVNIPANNLAVDPLSLFYAQRSVSS